MLVHGLVFLHLVFAVELVHLDRVDENKDEKNNDRTLLGKPEAQRATEEAQLVEWFGEEDAEAKQRGGNFKPETNRSKWFWGLRSMISLTVRTPSSFFLTMAKAPAWRGSPV